MLILVLFAFLAGIVTVLSPCILPVLPIVLSGGLGGDKRKPLGVVAGFVTSFTFFTLFLSTIVRLTGIPADSLRTVSIAILIVFGISLILPQVQKLIESAFTKLANLGPKQQKPVSGFWGGFLVGISLGILWTPCVGPILAAVISLALTGSVSGGAVIITLAYSLGTAIPMLAIVHGGRNLLNRVPWLLQNTGTVQKVFGVIMIATALAISFNLDRKFQTYILDTFPQYGVGLTAFEENDLVKNALDGLRPGRSSNVNNSVASGSGSGDAMVGKPMEAAPAGEPAPELQPGGEWFNSDPLTLAGLRGKVVLVDFWTYSCINCIRTLPYLRSWHQKYADQGLVIIGVHAPEFEFEKSAENVRKAIADFELPYPVVQDNDFATWRAYNNRYWPAKYLIDKNGNIRYTHFGEGRYDETENMIRELLKESGATVSGTVQNQEGENYSRTPELYLGWRRLKALVSPERIAQNIYAEYTLPQQIPRSTFGLAGRWMIGEEFARPDVNGRMWLAFEAKEVFLVIGSRDGAPAQIQVWLDGLPISPEMTGSDTTNGILTVDANKLYHVVSLPEPGLHALELIFPEGVEAYAFTFG